MDTSKLFAILCAFLLLICITFSITSLVLLRNTIDATDARLETADVLLADLSVSIEKWKKENDSVSVSTDTDSDELDADILYHRFILRETGDRIGVYTANGHLIRTIETIVSTLPPAERDALSAGICVDSWEELFERIQDYES